MLYRILEIYHYNVVVQGGNNINNYEEQYAALHVHSDYSLLDSTTDYKLYVDRACELEQKAIAFTEHGNIYNWVLKKIYCDEKHIKYIHGVEIYMTKTILENVRDNYHTILIAKNKAGVNEINQLVSIAGQDDHKYYKPRITFDEFLKISNNVIKISACLASPLNKLPEDDEYYLDLLRNYDYLEVQPHVNSAEQIFYNEKLYNFSKKYGIPLIAGTDTHNISKYKAECRGVLQAAKEIEYDNEDEYDLTYKSYTELVEMFKKQGCLKEDVYLEAINNTNVVADLVEDFELDISFKYPILYQTKENDEKAFIDLIAEKYKYKLDNGIIKSENIEGHNKAIPEEIRVFSKIEMSGFMLFMSEMLTWCRENGIPIGFGRGSVTGSRVAYITDITDLDPEEWKTVFSRFCNEDRKEIGDIDIDVAGDDREKVYDYIISRFGKEKTAFILAFSTIVSKGTIDEIGRGLSNRWSKKNLIDEKEIKKKIKEQKELKKDADFELLERLNKELKDASIENSKKAKENPYSLSIIARIKEEFDDDPEKTKAKYPDIFYYYEGLLGTKTAQSVHPAGIVASPITLSDNYGIFYDKDGRSVLQIDMAGVHDVSLVKYDILGLRNVKIIRDCYKLMGQKYPLSYQINWYDEAVWTDMLRSPVGVFQMESPFAFTMLSRFKPKSIFDMSLITASIRPSGESYRDPLMQHKINKNPSEIIDKLLENNLGYLVYQEDVIAFLKDICGFSGSKADNARRCIARKDDDALALILPEILEGYCTVSPQPRDVAEKEAKAFVQIIADASRYMFGYNHSIAYCLIGYLCAYLRYYYPFEFITSYLNSSETEEDIADCSELARLYEIEIVSPKFGLSRADYMYDKHLGVISKGIRSIKFLNSSVAEELYALKDNKYNGFIDLLLDISTKTCVNSRQLEILIKLDFFIDFGNAKTLMTINENFLLLKCGASKQISKEAANHLIFKDCIAVRSTAATANSDSKNYIIEDMSGLLHDVEYTIVSKNMENYSATERIEAQLEYLGYIDITSKDPKDKRKLIILDIKPLISKSSKDPWAYRVNTRSICTGKEATLNVYAEQFRNNPLKKMDIIDAGKTTVNTQGYWYLWSWTKE